MALYGVPFARALPKLRPSHRKIFRPPESSKDIYRPESNIGLTWKLVEDRFKIQDRHEGP